MATKAEQRRAEQRRAQRARARVRAHDPAAPWHGTTSGYTNHCCRCDACRIAYKAYHDEWRKRPEVAERIRANARAAARRPHNILRSKATQYGIDVATLGAYLEEGICFACGRHVDRLVVDHDHKCCPSFRKVCGECVRGLLCDPCNKTLGMVEDNRDRLRALIDYLDRWEARHAPKSA